MLLVKVQLPVVECSGFMATLRQGTSDQPSRSVCIWPLGSQAERPHGGGT